MRFWRQALFTTAVSVGLAACLPLGIATDTAPFTVLVASDEQESASFLAAEGYAPDALASNLAAAFALLSERQPACSATIVIASKITRVGTPIVVRQEARALDCPLTIRSMKGMRARITGSVAIDHWGGKLSGPRLEELSPQARAHVVVLPLKDYGLDFITDDTIRDRNSAPHVVAYDIFSKGERLPNARWPNEGYLPLQKHVSGQRFDIALDPVHVRRWTGETGFRVQGYLHHDYSFDDYPASVLDAERGVVRFNVGNLKYDLTSGHRMAVRNVLTELDQPGEWYFDRKARALYLWPLTGDAMKTGVEVSRAESIFRFQGVSNVVLQDLSIDMVRGDAVMVLNSNHVTIRNVDFSNTGARAAVVQGGMENRIEKSRFEMLGSGAVFVSGGSRKTLTPSHHIVESNLFRRTAELLPTPFPALSLNGVGQIARDNRFEDMPWTAIFLTGNDHLIENNVFRETLLETSDAGIVYTGRDWTSRGTVIRANIFLGANVPKGRDVRGIYIDDLSGGQTVADNIFVCVKRPVSLSGGNDNEITGNFFLRSSPAISLDNRGVTWLHRAFTQPQSTLQMRLRSVPYESELYRKRYPGLARILDAQGVPFGNHAEGNVLVESKAAALYEGVKKTNRIVGFRNVPLAQVWQNQKDICQALWDGDDLPFDAMRRLIAR